MADQEIKSVSEATKTAIVKDEIEAKLLAEQGREAITMAEGCMPGLMKYRRRHGLVKPLHGARIAGCTILDAKTAVLIETLIALGAEVQWAYSKFHPDRKTKRALAAALRLAGITVYLADETTQAYRSTVDFPFGQKANILLDYGGHLTFVSCSDTVKGIIECKHSGIQSLGQKYLLQSLKASVINGYKLLENANALYCSYYSYERSLVNYIKDFTNKFPASDNICVVVGYVNWSKSCARALRYAGLTVMITEYNSVHALEAEKDGFERVTLEEAYKLAKVLVIGTYSPKVDKSDLIKMMDGSLVCSISCCGHKDSDWSWEMGERYEAPEEVIKEPFESPDGYLFRFEPTEGKCVQILEYIKKCNDRNTPFAMSYSCTLQLLATIELWKIEDKRVDKSKWLNLLDNLKSEAALLNLSRDDDASRSSSDDLTKHLVFDFRANIRYFDVDFPYAGLPNCEPMRICE